MRIHIDITGIFKVCVFLVIQFVGLLVFSEIILAQEAQPPTSAEASAGCPTHSRFSNEWDSEITGLRVFHHRPHI
jgi:hypothetical protein